MGLGWLSIGQLYRNHQFFKFIAGQWPGIETTVFYCNFESQKYFLGISLNTFAQSVSKPYL